MVVNLSESDVGNLPVQLTRLVGRERVLRELGVALWETRLLSLCGPGGAGKTRLAMALADAVRADFLGGVWWVDLSATRDSRLVAQALSTALRPGEPISDLTTAMVAERLAGSSLIVLDNCEQVIEGCAELVSGLLGRSPSIRVIATSRQSLGVPGERIWRVSGLPITSEQTEGDALALFAERVREAGGQLDLDSSEVREAAGAICAALDGLPLALELAAARVRLLGVTQIAERLQHDTDFLRHPARGVPERHRTLRQTLDWSHELLTPAEQTLFRRLSVFRGDFSLRAVERICGDDGHQSGEVLDVLGALVDQSLVQVLDDRPEPRYRLPGTIRPYAIERLRHSGEHDAVADRHAAYFAEISVIDDRSTQGGGASGGWLDTLTLEHDNLREAMNWILAHAPSDAAALAVRIWPFLHQLGYYREARLWFEMLIASAGQIPEPVRAQVLLAMAEVEFLQCDYDPAAARLQQVLGLTDRPDDQATRAIALQRLGSIAREQGRYDQARAWHLQSLEIWESLGDRHGIAAAHDYQGFIAWLRGDCAGAQALCSLALSEFRHAGALQPAASALINLGAAALYSGDPTVARESLEEALAISRRLGFQEGIAWSLHELAILSRHARRTVVERAQMLRDALLVHHQLGDRWRLASVLEEIAGSLLCRPDPGAGTGLLAFAAQLRDRLTAPIPPVEQPDRDAAVARLRRQLGPAAFDGSWSAGTRWTLDQSVDVAVTAIDELTRDSVARGTPILTARELAVLELLTQGDTNREIAAALYISPSTAGVHVSNILRKLGAKRRVDAAGIAHKLGLLPVG